MVMRAVMALWRMRAAFRWPSIISPIKLPVSIIQVALTIIIVVLLVAAATTTTTTTTTATLIIITIIAMLIMLIPTTMLAKLTNALHENRC